MAATTLQRVTRQIRDTLARQSAEELTDGDLLQRFTTQEDEAAFAQLVLRHGTMVLGVSRRLLHNPHDAEDVFQAAFLLLARHAAGIRSHSSIAAWLFAVARRLALRVRSADARRSFHETQVRTMSTPTFDDAPHDDELRAILDQELARLPSKYRAPLVLCYLEGLGRAAAARRLGWKPGTTKIRLERGRNLLRQRLVARGLGTVGLAALCGTAAATASSQVVQTTVRAAVSLVRGESAGSLVSARALALVASMRTVAFLARLKLAALLLLTTGLLGMGLPWFVHPTAFAEPAVAFADPTPLAEAAPAVRGDQAGDPLPADARARLGTTRWRLETPIAFVAYTPDGKQLVTVSSGGVIYRWDVETGKELLGGGRRLPAGLRVNAAALAPDGKTLALATGTDVILWNLETGNQLRRWKEPASPIALVFGLDGKTLIGRGTAPSVFVWDVAEGKELRKFVEPQGNPGAFLSVNKLGISADGKVVAVPAAVGAANKVRRWEIETGKELTAVENPEKSYARPIFAPDGKTMAWISTGSGIVSLWDMETDKEIRKFDEPLAGMNADVVFSPDGKLVAAVTRESAVCLWDVATGKVKRKLTTLGRAPLRDVFAFSTDGQRVALGSGDVVRQFDVATGKELDGPSGHRGPLSATTLTPDGKTAISTGVDATLRVWDAATGKPRHRWDLPTAALTALTPDGRTLALGGGDRVYIWDATEGQERMQWKLAEQTLGGLAVSPDGKLAAARVFDGTIRLWDAVSGKEIYSIPDPEGVALPAGIRASGNYLPPILGLAFSPDGTTLATFPVAPAQGQAQKPNAVHLWSVANGRLIRRFEPTPLAVKNGAFSADGRTLATLNAGAVALWETASGKERLQFKVGITDAVCFTPDGKTLLVGGADGVVRLYETAARKEVGQRTGHRSGVRSLAVSADGKTLVSGSADATGLVWDLPRLEAARVVVPEPAQFEDLWKDLADPDPAKGYSAARSLGAAPERTLAWLKERLEPVTSPDSEKLRKWIADLDSTDFAVRQTAEDELTRLGELAELALNKAMAGQPSLETKQRLDRLLQVQALPENQLRIMRALAILEEMGTPEVRKLVGRLAAGAEGSQVTRDAKATLGRLARTPVQR